MIYEHVGSRNAVDEEHTNTMMSLLHIPSRSQLHRRRTYFAFSFIAIDGGQYVSCPFDARRAVVVNSRKRSSGGDRRWLHSSIDRTSSYCIQYEALRTVRLKSIDDSFMSGIQSAGVSLTSFISTTEASSAVRHAKFRLWRKIFKILNNQHYYQIFVYSEYTNESSTKI